MSYSINVSFVLSGVETPLDPIKYIIADRYVDKVGLEIAKNGFYIPIVDKEGNVLFTEKMYEY